MSTGYGGVAAICGGAEVGAARTYRGSEVADMRYLVVLQRNVTFGEIFCDVECEEEGVSPDAVRHQEVSKVILCADTRAVHEAVRQPGFDKDWKDADWAVFEVVDGKAHRRALVFKMDGPVSYDVEVQ